MLNPINHSVLHNSTDWLSTIVKSMKIPITEQSETYL